jgi:hypothetical protein
MVFPYYGLYSQRMAGVPQCADCVVETMAQEPRWSASHHRQEGAARSQGVHGEHGRGQGWRGGAALGEAVRLGGHLSTDTTTSESVANRPNPYILVDGMLIPFRANTSPTGPRGASCSPARNLHLARSSC